MGEAFLAFYLLEGILLIQGKPLFKILLFLLFSSAGKDKVQSLAKVSKFEMSTCVLVLELFVVIIVVDALVLGKVYYLFVILVVRGRSLLL